MKRDKKKPRGMPHYEWIQTRKPKRLKFSPPATQNQSRYRDYLQSDHWKIFRISVLVQRGYKCELCGSTREINLHHLTYVRLGHELPTDVQVLCYPCHSKVHMREKYYAISSRPNAAEPEACGRSNQTPRGLTGHGATKSRGS